MSLFTRGRNLFHRSQLNRDIQEELQSHIEMRIADLIDSGMTPEQARRTAMLKFGNPVAMKEKVVGVDAALGLDRFFRDVRYAFRQLRKSPEFAITAILTLALGIGVATAMFAIVDGVLLRPLPFPHAERLFRPVGVDAKGEDEYGMQYADLEKWQEATRNSAEIAYERGDRAILDTPTGARLIFKDAISANLLTTLRTQPILGRGLVPQEQEDDQSRVALLSFATWRTLFGSNPKILGQTVHIDGELYSVIGIMPQHFADAQFEVWTPMPRSKLKSRSSYDTLLPILRLKSGYEPAALQAALSSVQAHIAQNAKPGDDVATHVHLVGLGDSLVADVRPALTALEIAVCLVWLIACCNVAGLLLARIASRSAEINIRSALGAGKWRIMRQFLTESLLLSAAGALLGLGLAAFTIEIFRRTMEEKLPQAQNVHLNPTVMVTLVGFTILTGLTFGIFPAVLAARSPIAEALKSGSPTSSRDRGQAHLRNVLLIGEVALCMVLLVGAGLMLRTVYAPRHVHLGFRTDHIVLANLTVPNYDYKGRDLNTELWRPLLERVQNLPGVQFASLSTVMPIGHSIEIQTVVYSPGTTKSNVMAVIRAASPEQLQVLGIRMPAGRFFSAHDTSTSTPVAVVNQVFVQRYFSGKDAIGEPIRFGRVPMQATIMGVVDDVHQEKAATPSRPEIYICVNQLRPEDSLYLPLIGRFMELAVRTRAAPLELIPELRRVIRRENPELVAEHFSTMDQAVEESIGDQNLAAQVIGIFGGLALLITVVGLYGLLSYSVAQRTREISIRIALGADRAHVKRMILRQALILLAAGIAAGLALSFWASRFLTSFLYGVSTHDSWTLVSVPCTLVLCGVLAAFIPARRAASIDPVQALRSE